MPTVDTHYLENQASTIQFQFGTDDRLTLPQASLVNGDRYLLLFKGIFGPNPGRGRYRVLINGVEFGGAQTRGTVACSFSSGRMKEISGFLVFTAGSVGDIVLQAVAVSNDAGKRWGSEQMLLINLDDALVENQDWFLATNDVNDGSTVEYGGEAQKPSLTWTPDGMSDYLVLANLGFVEDNNDAAVWRLYDTTDAAERVICSQGGGNIGDERPLNLRAYVYSAPPNSSRTVEIGYKSFPTKNKNTARIFVLRLNAFTQHAFVQTDLNATPSGIEETLAGPVAFTPDTNQEVLVLASLMGEIAPSFGSGLGYRGRVLYDGNVAANTAAPGLSSWVNISGNGTYTKPESWGGNNLFAKLTGQSPANAVALGRGESANGAEHTWRTQTLVVLSTEVANPIAPSLSNESPIPSATNVDRFTNIGFHVGGVDNVDLSTLQVEVQIGGAGYIAAVINGSPVNFPPFGPNSSVTPQGDGYDVVIDFNGVYSAGATIDVRVNADNGPGTISMPQVDYSFVVGTAPLTTVQVVQTARGS